MTSVAPSVWRVICRVVLVIAALLIATIATQALWLAPLASSELSRRSGRAVHVDTMWIGLSSSLSPVVHCRGIRIDNAPWADARRPLVALGEATAVFSWTSIEQRRPVIALWVLADGEVDLERRADGLRNWRLTNPDYRGPGRWKVLAVQAERATVRFVHGGIDLDLSAVASAASGASSAGGEPSRPTHIELQGRWRTLPFAASVDTGPVLTFLETGRTFAVGGHLDAGGARLELDGTAGDIVHLPTVDARVSLAAPSLAPFTAFVGTRHHEAKAIRVEGALKASNGSYALSGAKARLGATDLAGELSWTRADERSVVRARLDSESTDIDDLRWLSGIASVRARAVSDKAAPAEEVAASAAPRSARELDGELSFTARRLHALEIPALQSVRLEATLAAGRLTLSRFDVGIAQGHVSGRASVALHDTPLHADADVTASGIRVEQFLRDAEGKSRVTGALRGHAVLKAQGGSVATLREGVSGRITASLVGGTISSLLDAEMGLQGGKIVRSFIGGAEPIAIGCAVAVVDVEHGAGRLRTLVVDTERTHTIGRGAIDVGAETVDVVLTPQAKQGGFLNLDRSIRIHGSLRHPARELVARADTSASHGRECAPDRP